MNSTHDFGTIRGKNQIIDTSFTKQIHTQTENHNLVSNLKRYIISQGFYKTLCVTTDFEFFYQTDPHKQKIISARHRNRQLGIKMTIYPLALP